VSDLTAKEQDNVRVALRFLRARCGTWATVAKALHVHGKTVSSVACGHKPVTALLAFRVARLAGVGVDEVLNGTFPPAGACPLCGARCE
jgi:hypothetical protein